MVWKRSHFEFEIDRHSQIGGPAFRLSASLGLLECFCSILPDLYESPVYHTTVLTRLMNVHSVDLLHCWKHILQQKVVPRIIFFWENETPHVKSYLFNNYLKSASAVFWQRFQQYLGSTRLPSSISNVVVTIYYDFENLKYKYLEKNPYKNRLMMFYD